jgi:hypothetical protein
MINDDCSMYFKGSPGILTYPASNGNVNECFSLVDKDNNIGDITITDNYWKEQINLYGQKVGYILNNFTTASADNLYGEQPTQAYSPPQTIKMLIDLNENALMLSKYGLQADDEITAYVHISSFYETFGWGSEPKSGDLFQLTEYGSDRPGGRDGKIFEITERLDEDSARINPLMGHYVWLIKAKRFEYSFEPGLSGEAVNQQVFDDTKNNTVSGADKPYDYSVEDASKKIFDYSKTDYGDVYGNY